MAAKNGSAVYELKKADVVKFDPRKKKKNYIEHLRQMTVRDTMIRYGNDSIK